MLQRFVILPLQLLCLLAAAGFALTFLHIAVISLFYPFPMEWMEGHSIDIVQRILDGKPLYTEPSLEYVPYIYTPYYFYISAFVSLFTGVDFLAARLVSLLAALGIARILYAWIRKEGGSAMVAIITGGLYLATYNLSGRWFDVARVDSLYVFLMIAGLYVYYFARHKYDMPLAAVLFATAFFTKQSAIIALLPAFLAALYLDRKQALRCGIVTAAIIVVGCVWLQFSSNGWFSFYIYDVPAGHPNDVKQIDLFWTRDIFPYCLAMLGLSAMILLALLKIDSKKLLWYGGVFAGLFGSAYLSRIHSFGYTNVLMPAHLALALLSGIALVYARKLPLLEIACTVIIASQFYVLQYDPSKLIPTPEAEERGENFIKEIAKIDGDILFSELQFVQSRVGKKTYSIGMAGFDIMRSDLGDKNHIKEKYINEIKTALEQQRFSAVILGRFIKVAKLKENYELVRAISQPQEFIAGAVFFDKAQIYMPSGQSD